MERTLEYTITEVHDDKLLIGCFLQSMSFSAKNIIQLKKNPASILLNGEPAYINRPLKVGDHLTIHIIETESSPKIEPVKLPLDILYEDEDFLLVNKPADMPIHPSLNNYTNTLANSVAYYYQSQGIPYVFRCINRLDRDTTGVTLLAKHMVSAGMLSTLIKGQDIKREYLAIVQGTSLPNTGTIDAPIGRVDGSTIERCIDPVSGDSAITHYQVLKRLEDKNLSLVLLWLETGRTHQIRVHMKHLGYPLIGDYIYNPDTTYINRQALHSCKLSFVNPITKEAMQFVAPLPEDMNSLIGTDFSI